jgi:phosphonate transport system substrate-binding protein
MTSELVRKRKSLLGGPVALVLLLAAIAGGVLLYVYYSDKPSAEPDSIVGLRATVEHQEQLMKMAEGYTDADGDLIADRPAGPGLNPEVLVFSEIPTANLDKDEAKWKPFIDHLSKVTGKKVILWRPAPEPLAEGAGGDGKSPAAPVQSAPGLSPQMKALREDRLHITAFSTGAVTAAVNTAGFVPLFCPANDQGKFGYEMEILVPAGSTVQKPEDLRGKTIALVSLSSNSGGRAGLVYLKSIGLSPMRDYKFVFKGTHEASIRAVAEGQVDAACVANDLLRFETEAGRIKPEQIRSIYKSQTFPPLCFGVHYNLDPALAAKIKEAFSTFSGLSGVYGGSPNRAKFAPVDYKRDWSYVREVESKLRTVVD